MKLLVTAFYRDSARYFVSLAKHIKATKNIEITLHAISIYPCAQKYFEDNGIKSIYAPTIAKNIENQELKFNEGIINDLVSFHSKTFKYFGENRDAQLSNLAKSYITFINNYFKNEKFDRVIVFGSSRLIPKTVEYVAKNYKVPVLYFEQAPFGRTIFSTIGVGSNIITSSMENKVHEKKESFNIDSKRSSKIHYWKHEKKTIGIRFNQLKTLLLSFQPKIISNYLPPDLYTGPFHLLLKRIFAKIKLKYFTDKKHLNSRLPIITLFLQSPVDAQFFEESPIYDDFLELVGDVMLACPDEYQLVIREHPEHLGCYDKKLYQLIHENPKVKLDNSVSFEYLLNNSELVVVNNSTVGFQALSLGKKVLVLGNSYYSKKGITYDLIERTRLPELVRFALQDYLNQNQARNFVEMVLNEVFYKGHFQDKDLEFEEKMIAILINGR